MELFQLLVFDSAAFVGQFPRKLSFELSQKLRFFYVQIAVLQTLLLREDFGVPAVSLLETVSSIGLSVVL